MQAAGFELLYHSFYTTPRCQLWKNKHGKHVTVDYTDNTFEHVWTESLETALQARDLQPKDPFAGFWQTLFSGAKPPPPKDDKSK